jgi:tyrosine-protein kinase Etk/Wzc
LDKKQRDMTSKGSVADSRRAGAIEVRSEADEDVSLLALGTTLVRSRWRIVRWMLIGAVAAALTILPRPRTYLASASFISEGSEANRSSLVALAGQIGIAIPTGSQSLSPDFYLSLLRSRVVLLSIVRDTIPVQEMGGKRMSVLDLFEIPSGTTARREELGVNLLQRLLSVSVAKSTGIVEFSIATRWRSVSLALVTALLNGVDDYNERTRQGQATAERKFIESRLSLATSELRNAENRMAAFLNTNRNFASSPDLVLERDRLQRDLTLRQQVFTTMTQAYEEARIREVRDTPVITIFEPPFAPTVPKARGLVIGVLLGLTLGALFGVLLSLTSGLVRRGRESGNSEAEEFASALREAKGQLFGGVRRFKRNAGGTNPRPGVQ